MTSLISAFLAILSSLLLLYAYYASARGWVFNTIIAAFLACFFAVIGWVLA